MGPWIRRNSWLFGVFLSAMLMLEGRGQGGDETAQQPGKANVRPAGQSPAPASHSPVEELAEGDPAPDASFVGLNAKVLRLSELTGRGKNVVLIFSRAHW
ncbi:MAG: hypothetical protein ACR2OA_22265 [Rubripirellula sp.]